MRTHTSRQHTFTVLLKARDNMATITMIPAVKRVGSRIASKDETPKIRVAAYCRVSTETDEQATSYDLQIEHYTDYIKKNPSWELAGIYADDGISGTNTKKREEFNRMIEDCKAGRIDMVITKSISRFARNTLDCLNYIRELKDRNIAVYFEKEAINTMDAKGELMLTIMASLAQQESESLSQNVRLGLQFRYQKGKVQVCTNRFLGYDKDKEGNLIVNQKEAKVVKRIYREYLEGKSYYEIGHGLTEDGIKTAAGSDYWLPSTLRKILRNEKYIGDALLQKTVTTNVLTKKRVENKGYAPQYYVEGSHEAIIPKDLYMMVQAEIERRAHLETGTGKRRVYSGKYALSSIVVCAHCGDLFQRTHWTINGKKRIVWRCVSRLHRKDADVDCPARTISEADLQAAVVEAINKVYAQQDTLIPQVKENIFNAIGNNNSAELRELNEKIAATEQEILKRNRSRQDCEDLGQEIIKLRKEKYRLQLEDAEKENTKQKIADLEKALANISGKVTEYDDALVRKLIERVTVYDDYVIIEFKSGIERKIKM